MLLAWPRSHLTSFAPSLLAHPVLVLGRIRGFGLAAHTQYNPGREREKSNKDMVKPKLC